MTRNKLRNQVFLVFDSLRWDVFQKANLPFLKKLGEWKLAYTPGNYTFPAHMSFLWARYPRLSITPPITIRSPPASASRAANPSQINSGDWAIIKRPGPRNIPWKARTLFRIL